MLDLSKSVNDLLPQITPEVAQDLEKELIEWQNKNQHKGYLFFITDELNTPPEIIKRRELLKAYRAAHRDEEDEEDWN